MLVEELEARTGSLNILGIQKPDSMHDDLISLIQHLARKKTPGAFLLLTKPYDIVKREIDKLGINTEKIIFIDCMSGEKRLHEGNVFYIPSIEDLTGICIVISQFFDSIQTEKFLVIDALDPLLIYNEPKTVASFLRSITEHGSRSLSKNIILTSGKPDSELVRKISPFFDKIVREHEPHAQS